MSDLWEEEEDLGKEEDLEKEEDNLEEEEEEGYMENFLYEACKRGDTEAVHWALREGAAVNERRWGCFGSTPLIAAAQNGPAAIVELLLKQPGINLNCKDEHGLTALHFACIFGRVDILELLLAGDSGRSLEARDSLGFSPLMCAVEGGHEGCVELMVRETGIELETGDWKGLEERAR